MLRNQRGLHIIAVLGLLVSACGDDGGSEDEASGTESATESGTGTEAEAGTEVGSTDAETTDAETTAGTTDAETTDAETTAETTDAETTDATTETTAETTDATTETTGNGVCGDFETADECTMAGCQVVNGSKLKANGPDSPCLEPSEFLGCIEPMACGDALSWFCQGNNVFQTPDTCGPEGFDPCEGPADVAACP